MLLTIVVGLTLGMAIGLPDPEDTLSSLETSPAAGPYLEQAAEVEAEALTKEEVIDQAIASDRPMFSELPVPDGLEDRVRLWELVYGEYPSSHFILYHLDHPGIIYQVVPDLKGNRTRAVSMIRSRLYTLHHLCLDSADPVAEIRNLDNAEELLALYHAFEKVPGSEKFAAAANRDKIGVIRGRKDELTRSYQRARDYLPEMERIFRENNLPASLTRMVFVESMFDRRARSSLGAVGVWQLMPASAPQLAVSRQVDERRDPIASTRAAARILAENHRRFESWPLAVTAYIAGPGAVSLATRRAGTDSLPQVFERYDHESFGFAVKNFYARLLGVLEAEQNLGLGFDPEDLPPGPVDFDLVTLPRDYNISELSQKLGMSIEMLIQYNPSWTYHVEKGWEPVPRGTRLKVPEGGDVLAREYLGIAQRRHERNPSDLARAD